MFASIIIVTLAILFGSLSIFVQYIKDPDRRKRIEDIVSIPAALALLGTIAWLMSHAHHLDDLGVSSITLGMAITFFLLIPAVTYIFSPAFKDAGIESLRSTTPQTQQVPNSQCPTAAPILCRSIIVLHDHDDLIINGEIVEEDPQFLLE